MNAVFLSSDVVMLEFGLALVVDEVQGRDTHSTRQRDVKRWSDGVEDLVLAAITLPLSISRPSTMNVMGPSLVSS